MIIYTQTWLSRIPDDIDIRKLCIPGTHDTMTYPCEERYYKTQYVSLQEQLNMGIRFFDIRLRKEMVAAHREWISNISAHEIFNTFVEFLKNNPREFLIVRIQNANEKKDDYKEYGIALKKVISRYIDYFYLWEDNNFPLLKNIRGKIFCIECSPIEYNLNYLNNNYYALAWHNSNFLNIQDLWNGPSLDDKRNAIKYNLLDSVHNNKLNINHISATNGSLKYPDCYSEYLNEFSVNMINEISQCSGIIIFDYASQDICLNIIIKNFIFS